MADFPLLVNFSVVSVSVSDEITISNALPTTRRRLSLVLRARIDTEIQLSSGELLESMDIHLSLVAGLASAQELATELTEEDIGFLIHTTSTYEPPFIHGAVLWPDVLLPYHLLAKGLRANVLLTISSLPQLLNHEEPHVWQSGRKELLRISSYSIGCANDSAHEHSV